MPALAQFGFLLLVCSTVCAFDCPALQGTPHTFAPFNLKPQVFTSYGEKFTMPTTLHTHYMGTFGWNSRGTEANPLNVSVRAMLGDPFAHVESIRFTALKMALQNRSWNEYTYRKDWQSAETRIITAVFDPAYRKRVFNLTQSGLSEAEAICLVRAVIDEGSWWRPGHPAGVAPDILFRDDESYQPHRTNEPDCVVFSTPHLIDATTCYSRERTANGNYGQPDWFTFVVKSNRGADLNWCVVFLCRSRANFRLVCFVGGEQGLATTKMASGE